MLIVRSHFGRANWRSAYPLVGVESVRLIQSNPPRDLLTEMRTLAARANAMYAEGLTAWHERSADGRQSPRWGGPPALGAG